MLTPDPLIDAKTAGSGVGKFCENSVQSFFAAFFSNCDGICGVLGDGREMTFERFGVCPGVFGNTIAGDVFCIVPDGVARLGVLGDFAGRLVMSHNGDRDGEGPIVFALFRGRWPSATGMLFHAS